MLASVTHLIALPCFLLASLTNCHVQETSWQLLQQNILKDWDELLIKHKADLHNFNTFSSIFEVAGKPILQTYKINGDLKLRSYESQEISSIQGYNDRYSFLIERKGVEGWAIVNVVVMDRNEAKNVVRFPEIEDDFMQGGLKILRPCIEAAKRPKIEQLGEKRVRLVFDSAEDEHIHVAEVEIDRSYGMWLPVVYASKSKNGEVLTLRRQWELTTAGIPRLVGGRSGDVEITNASQILDKNLSDQEFYLSYYGFQEPTLPERSPTNWWLIGLVVGGLGVVVLGYYVRSKQNT
jgi:hypothetical protein